MKTRSAFACRMLLSVLVALAAGGVARAGSITGVIASYESGNQGTDLTVMTSNGKSHRLWFDNMKKPLFEGTPLPWCPDFPCDGWPKKLVLKKTHVRVYTVQQTVGGHAIVTPTRIELLR